MSKGKWAKIQTSSGKTFLQESTLGMYSDGLKIYSRGRGGGTNCSPQAKLNLLTLFVNKVLLEHSHIHSCTYCLWLLLNYNGKAIIQKPCGSQTKYLLSDPLRKPLPTPAIQYDNPNLLYYKYYLGIFLKEYISKAHPDLRIKITRGRI